MDMEYLLSNGGLLLYAAGSTALPQSFSTSSSSHISKDFLFSNPGSCQLHLPAAESPISICLSSLELLIYLYYIIARLSLLNDSRSNNTCLQLNAESFKTRMNIGAPNKKNVCLNAENIIDSYSLITQMNMGISHETHLEFASKNVNFCNP